MRLLPRFLVVAAACWASTTPLQAQSVCLPAPRLLTVTPMGGQVGTTVEVAITGDHLDGTTELNFSHPAISAVVKPEDSGTSANPTRFLVTIAPDCPLGVHEARVMTRLGISSTRAFVVGAVPEATRTKPNLTVETAMPVSLDSVCHGVLTRQAVDHYSFTAQAGQRVVVDCAAAGIDAKLKPVLILADAAGNDLKVERRGGAVDYTIPEAGTYMVKVHDLTFSGGSEYYYRLALQTVAAGAPIPPQPSTASVSSFSWPPPGVAATAVAQEAEPNDSRTPQAISLPCDLAGSFYPAADVDVYQFSAKKGEVWWVEVASERLGRATDAAVVVQKVAGSGADAQVTDLVELTDIPSPIKVSSNGYSYDGPPYNCGSTDVLGKIEIPEDGTYRLQLLDSFGGTRSDPNNLYRLIVRKPTPDFAVVGWALHMELRNGDRAALSKPIALRGGTTMAFEVLAIRRDGFTGAIKLALENLPEGVTATGLTIPAGQSRGILLITADAKAAQGYTLARFVGRATIDGQEVSRDGRFASMAWPIRDASQEIPKPRLLADIPVSVSGAEQAPVTIEAAEKKVWEVAAGQTLTIPLNITRRSEFSGSKIQLRTFGAGFEGNPEFEAPLTADASVATLDTAKLKTPPGDYTIAFYGSAVAKYRENADAVAQAEAAVKSAKQKVDDALSSGATAEQRKPLDAALAAAEKTLQAAQTRATPKDIVDIVVSTPLQIRVTPAPEAKKP